jgi:nitroimidazol reductase NimA-like FMN-containing flavoprotein (pyridoxamine 5'-phosphate oxidase superfamily)
VRRHEQRISDREALEGILSKANVLRIGLCDNNVPYVVPVSFGYEENCIYIHSSPVGKKIDMIRRNNIVCFQTEIGVELVSKETPCECAVQYRSLIGYGKAHLIEDVLEKTKALNTIMEHYHGKGSWEYRESLMNRTAVIKIEIDSMEGKRSKE